MIYYVKIETQKEFDEFQYVGNMSDEIERKEKYLPKYFEINGDKITFIGYTFCGLILRPNYNTSNQYRYMYFQTSYGTKTFLTFEEYKLIRSLENDILH